MTDDCLHLLYSSSWTFYHLAAGQLLLGQPVRYGKGRLWAIRPVHQVKKNTHTHQPGHSPQASLGWPPSMFRTYFVYARSCLYWTAGKALRFSEFFFSLFMTKHIDLVHAE